MTMVIDNGNESPLASPDRWTPVLCGEIFCSPACGFNCTKHDFDLAASKAAALVSQLANGWQPRVWENCGWHFEAVKRGATVSIDDESQYEATVRFRMQDRHESCVSESRACPVQAVEAVIKNINDRVAVLTRALLSLEPDPIELKTISNTFN